MTAFVTNRDFEDVVSESLEIQSMFMHGSHHLLSSPGPGEGAGSSGGGVGGGMLVSLLQSPTLAAASSAVMMQQTQEFLLSQMNTTSSSSEDGEMLSVTTGSSSEIDMDQEIARFLSSESLNLDENFSEVEFNFDFPRDVEGTSLLMIDDDGAEISFESVDEFTNLEDDDEKEDEVEDEDSFVLSSVYKSIGHVMSKVCNHKKYCKKALKDGETEDQDDASTVKQERSSCCRNMTPGTEFDFQVEQSSLSGCECEHKKVYWISIRSAQSYSIVGEVAVTESKVLAPLVLGGFIRMFGELVLEDKANFADGIIPFRITAEANLQFIQDSADSLSMEQIMAFLKLKDMIGQGIGGKTGQKFCSILAKLSQKAEIDGPREPQNCRHCQSKTVKIKKQPAKRKAPHPISTPALPESSPRSKPSPPKMQKTSGSSASGGAGSMSMVQNLLEERRRQRARDQIANCSDKEVGRMTEAIHHVAVKQYNHVISVFGRSSYSYGPFNDVLEIMDDALSDFVTGKNPLEGIGSMIGVTQAVFQKITESNGRSSIYQAEVARVEANWRRMFEGYSPGDNKAKGKKNRLIAVPLAKRLANTLFKTLERHHSEGCGLGHITLEVLKL
jgi:hypothetical protein